jgi:hypothetical protein
MRWRRGEIVLLDSDNASYGLSITPDVAPASFCRLVNEEYKIWKKNTPFLYGEPAPSPPPRPFPPWRQTPAWLGCFGCCPA